MLKLQRDFRDLANRHFVGIKEHLTNKIKFCHLYFKVLSGNAGNNELKSFDLPMDCEKKTLINAIRSQRIQKSVKGGIFGPANSTKGLKRVYKNNVNKIKDLFAHLDDGDNLKNIIVGKPSELVEAENWIEKDILLKTLRLAELRDILNVVFSYDRFCKNGENENRNKYNAYSLADLLQANTCLYCNRQYTFTVINNGNIIRPEFDHYFSQKVHPLLALSFYNLIPSCHICNANLKISKEFTLDKYLHPYIDGFGEDASFIYDPESFTGNYSDKDNYDLDIEIQDNCPKEKKVQIEGNIEAFKLKEIYLYHKDIVGEIALKCQRYNVIYNKSLKTEFPGLTDDEGEIYRFYFGNYYEYDDHVNRILAKFTRDIIKCTPGLPK